jgi:hypothetical protein
LKIQLSVAMALAAASNSQSLRGKRYGGKFGRGFGNFMSDDDPLADVVVIGPRGTEHRCHQLLLTYHSEFFRAMFCNGAFREKEQARVTLGFEDPAGSGARSLFGVVYEAQIDLLARGHVCESACR